MDRFNSTDKIDWCEEPFIQGIEARNLGFDIISQNYFDPGSWPWKSFRAGWADEDQSQNSIKE